MTESQRSAIEEPNLPEAERRALLADLAERMFDPDGFDREALANIEELTQRDATEEEVRRLLEWFRSWPTAP